MRLNAATAADLPKNVRRMTYNRESYAPGIVHFGLGAFTRAHQAWYTDRAIDQGSKDWMITGVSLRSGAVADQINPQDGLYLTAEKSGAGTSYSLGGSIRNVLTAGHNREKVIAAIANPSTRIVSFTVTEKGYCRTPEGSLDCGLAAEGSFYPLVAEAMFLRRGSGAGGLTFLSCDNLASNGAVLQQLIHDYLRCKAPELEGWFTSQCTCPSTMVDRIVPATTEADRKAAEAATGLRDEALVVTEPFSQWVIEDNFANGRPDWQSAGAELVRDVAPYETAKLRLLNGAHSLLAYAGMKAGYTYVHEAISDSDLKAVVAALMQEAMITIEPAQGQDLCSYSASLIERFANPALNHQLSQIAMDGSQKLPQRWLATLSVRQQRGLTSPAILRGIAAWIDHLRKFGDAADDPFANQLAVAAQTPQPVSTLFGAEGILSSEWLPTAYDHTEIMRQLI